MKKEYLNEEWYQKAKKKIMKCSVAILIVSIIMGVLLIGIGAYKISDGKKTNEERYNAAYKQSEENVSKAKTRLNEIETEKEALSKQYEEKMQQCDTLNMSDANWFDDHSKCQREASSIDDQIDKLETEKFQLEKQDYTVYYDKVNTQKSYILIFLGIGVMFIGGALAFAVYMIAMRREIMAFTTQQVMPVAQEGIEKMAPTVGNAAKEIAKGIKEGMHDTTDSQPTDTSEESLSSANDDLVSETTDNTETPNNDATSTESNVTEPETSNDNTETVESSQPVEENKEPDTIESVSEDTQSETNNSIDEEKQV